MLTVTQLARKFGLSRATILYYERKGLLKPISRSTNGYRWYGKQEELVLKSILEYRSFGLPIAQISSLVDRQDEVAQKRILLDQFSALEKEILVLRQQQKAIVKLLEQSELLEGNMVTKDKWITIMKAAGLSDQDMMNWHRTFEKMEPLEHQKFLESLGVNSEEIIKIRQL